MRVNRDRKPLAELERQSATAMLEDGCCRDGGPRRAGRPMDQPEIGPVVQPWPRPASAFYASATHCESSLRRWAPTPNVPATKNTHALMPRAFIGPGQQRCAACAGADTSGFFRLAQVFWGPADNPRRLLFWAFEERNASVKKHRVSPSIRQLAACTTGPPALTIGHRNDKNERRLLACSFASSTRSMTPSCT